MPKNVVIIGAGGHAKVIADIITKSNDNVIGFLDDNLDIQNKTIYLNKTVLGTTKDIDKYKEYYFVIGIGNNNIRENIANSYDLKWYTAIHPNAIIANEVSIEEGSVVMAGSIINTGTKIGKHCIINTKSSLDHDNIIENYVHISPGATLAGTVHIKEKTWVCSGATIINNITIAKNNIIGAGSVVIKDINEENGTYVGAPARRV